MEELKVEDANLEDLKDSTQTFIANLSPSEFESLDFKESLDVKLSKTGETIGMFKINVTKNNVYEIENNGIMFEVTAECVGNVEQQVVCSFNAFAQLIYADGILRVSNQTHTELVKCGELQVNKITETKLHADGTLVIKRRINDENESQIILTPEEARTYLCDGASLLLLRLMAQTNLTQKLAFITLDGDGQICPVIYYVTDSQAANQENDAEPKVLTKIVRELHREEKIDDWMFCLFNTGKLYSWTHTNSPVYMECRTVEEELNGNSLEDVQQETSINENNVSEETVIDGGSHYANDALETNQSESQEKEDIPEDNERINADEDEGDKAKIENVDSTENLNFGVIPLSVRHEQDQQNLSTIDEEDEDLLSISQKIPNNPNNKQQNAASSGSTLHIRGLFEDALSETPLANSNEIPLVREQTFNSDSTMHIKGLFEETYRSESKISDENVANSVGNVLLVPDNANTSGSTMFLKNFFEAGKSAKTNVAKNEGQIENVVEREETFTSGSTMHLRGLFDSQNSIDNSRELSDSQTNNAVDAKAENTAVENYSELNLQKGNRGNTTDRTTSSSSSYHLRGLFASYKSGLNFQAENEDDNNTITRESTMEIHGLLDSTNSFGSQNVNAKMNDSNVILETDKENLSGFEADGEDKVSKNELLNTNSNLVELYEKFVSDKIFNGSTMQGDETNAEGYATDVNDNPSAMPTLLSCIPRHVLLDSLYHHHKPSPIPEEDEENVEQEERTTRETQDETYNPLQINETAEIVQTKTEHEPFVDFPLEMFDTKQSQGVLSRDTSLSFEVEPQYSPLNSVRAVNTNSGNGIFPPLPASPRGDKRMMKLMSRRLSALMTGLDNSIGDGEPVGEESDKVNKSASVQKEKKTNGDRVKRKKERVDKTLANVNEKLDYQSDFNSFNRFMVLSRESSQLITTPRNVVETPPPDDNNKTDDVINIDSNDNDNESATVNADNQLEESSLKRESLNLLVTELNTQSPDDGMGSSDASARLSEKSPSLTFENFNDVQKFFKSECENYVENHPEIRKILGDFLQALLIARPDEILPFASSYFQFVANMKKD